MLTSFAPMISLEASPGPLSVEQMTADAFHKESLLANCLQLTGDKYMACCLIYRGDVSTIEANGAVEKVKAKKTVNMVDWCPIGFKVGINNHLPGYIEEG